MSKVLEDSVKDYNDMNNDLFMRYTCHYCKKEILASKQDADIEVKEWKDITVQQAEFDDNSKITGFKDITQKVSANPGDDIYTFKCPYCGSYEKFAYKDLIHTFCHANGENNISFSLTKDETEAAVKFISEHKDCAMKLYNRRFFSSNGGQFVYTIRPTGLGHIVSIKCAICNEEKDITDKNGNY